MSLDLAFDILARDKGASQTLDKVADSAENAGDKLEGLGGKAAAGFGALGAGAVVAKGFADSLDIGAANDRLAAQLGLMPQQSEAFGRAAGDLFADAYGDSIGQVNDALAAVQTGIGDSLGPADDALSTTAAKALNLADVFDIDVADAVDRAGVLLRNGLAGDADEAFDLVTVAMQRMTPALRDELGDATTEYSKFFGALGINGSEMLGLLSQADDVFTLDKTGDAIKELTIRATDMSTTSVAAFEAAGLNAEDMAGKILAGGDTARDGFGEIIDGLRGIKDPVKQANAAIGLFGTPLEDLGTSEIPAFLESLAGMDAGLGDVSGAADRMGDTLADNASTKIESFKRTALQGLTDFLGGTVIPGVESLMTVFNEEGLGGVVERAGDMWSEAWPGIQEWLGEALASLGSWIVDVGAPAALAGLGSLLDTMLTWVTDEGLPMLGEGAKLLVPALTEWIARDAIPGIVDALPGILWAIGDWIITEGGPALAGFGADLAEALWDGLFELLSAGGEFAVDIAKELGNALIGLINEKVIDGLNDALEFDLKVHGVGFSVNAPDIPKIPEFADGGVMPGPLGVHNLALIAGGETILPTHKGGSFDALGEDQLLELRTNNRLLRQLVAAATSGGNIAQSRAVAAVMR